MAFTPSAALLWAPQAWVGGRWRQAVLLQAGDDGHWQQVLPDSPCPPQAQRLAAPVLPALVNAHSHAFQRAFVGQAERRDGAHDDFWLWRERMYGVALHITPTQLRAVAAHLYAELLAGGYTQVCEFHYLQHAPDGRPYGDGGGGDAAEGPAAMAQALADAAADAGIGLTLLPAVYERAGFAAPALRDEQRRFALGATQALALQRHITAWRRPGVNAGLAVHSLRAARPASITALAAAAGDGPLHVHVAEQMAEVHDCLAATGCRPVEWLARHGGLDRRWQLVHATHTLPHEVEAVARAGAGVVLCPGTEANLGDGLCDLPGWLAAGVGLTLGSDSQVTRQWPEELRWLEYGQRLLHQRRNLGAAPGRQASTAERLFDAVCTGGAAACGLAAWGLQPGARADLLLLDSAEPALCGLPPGHWLDGVVFAAPQRPFAATLVAGRWADPSPRAALAARAAAAITALTAAAARPGDAQATGTKA